MPDLIEKNVSTNIRHIEAFVRADSVNESERTAEFRFISDDNGGLRFGQFGPDFDDFGEFIEELSLDPNDIRLERMNSGAAPFLRDHSSGSIDNVIGVIEGVRIEADGAYARVRFAKDEMGERYFQRVLDGILKSVSVGYRSYRMQEVGRKEVEGKDTTIPVMRVTDYEPFEISLVAIPFDMGATVRKEESQESNSCTVFIRNQSENHLMPEENKAPEAQEAQNRASDVEAPKAPAVEKHEDPKVIAERAVKEERQRSLDIRSRVKQAGLDSEFADELIREDISAEDANKRIMDKWAEQSKQPEVQSQIRVMEPKVNLRDAMEANIALAVLPGDEDVRQNFQEKNGDFFNGYSLLEMGRKMLEVGGVDTQGMNRASVARKIVSFRSNFHARNSGSGAMHTSFDFPEILANVQNKFLRRAYAESPRTFMPLTTERTVNDFKEISNVQLGEGGNLLEVPEGAEYKQATIGEGAEKYTLVKYGRTYKLSWEMILNDDLSAFTNVFRLFGNAASRLESDLAWAQITGNPVLQTDGVALFDAQHNNLNEGGGAAALSEDTLSDMRTGMRTQVGLDGVLLNLSPSYLIVPANLETAGQKLLTAVTPNNTADVNVFSSQLSLITEPRLDADSTTRHYLATNTNQTDIIERASLAGEGEPSVFTEEGFDSDSIKFKARHNVAFKVLDFRGLQRNDGA